MVQLTSCNVGKPPRHLEAISHFFGPHGHNLQREQTSPYRPSSGDGDLETASPHWIFQACGTELNPSLCFQISVLTRHASKPSILGILEPQRSLLVAQQKEVGPDGSAKTPHRRIHLQIPQRHPDIIGRSLNYCSL